MILQQIVYLVLKDMVLKVVHVFHVKRIVLNVQQVQTVYLVRPALSYLVEIVLNVYLDVVYVIRTIMFNVWNVPMDIICKDKVHVFYAQLDVKLAVMFLLAKLALLDIS